jgi:hypothetical protein
MLVTALGFAPALAFAAPAAPAPKAPVAKKPKAPPPKKIPPVTAEHKKALADLFGGYKFGMSKDDVIGVLTKQLDDRYADLIKATSSVYDQDNLRKQKKADLARFTSSFVTFEGKNTPWDVSLVEDEFAHNTNESMLVNWENQNGKNQRRFFFFFNGKLWKMFVSLDTSGIPDDKKNFAFFQGGLETKYGGGDVDVDNGVITWRAGEFDVRAIDKLKSYDALCMALEDPTVAKDVVALRVEKAPPKKGTSSLIKSVIDTKGDDHPDTKQNSNAVDSVLNADGASKKK